MPPKIVVMEAAYAYLGHFAGNPRDLALVTAWDFQEALAWCDSVGQPDEGSFEAVQEPLVLRLQATLEEESDEEGTFQFVHFTPHPRGALAMHGGLTRFNDRAAKKVSTISGDIMRSYGPVCPKCDYRHFASEDCRAFLEPLFRMATYLVMLNDDPHDLAIVVGIDDEEEILEHAAEVGASPRILGPVDSGCVFNVRLEGDGSTRSDAHFTCHAEDTDWLEPLAELLRKAG